MHDTMSISLPSPGQHAHACCPIRANQHADHASTAWFFQHHESPHREVAYSGSAIFCVWVLQGSFQPPLLAEPVELLGLVPNAQVDTGVWNEIVDVHWQRVLEVLLHQGAGAIPASA